MREPLDPPARVATLLLVLVSVKPPAPANARLVAVIAPVWVTAVDAVRLIVELVAVSAPLMAIVPPVAEIGPLMLVALAKVILAVLVALPSVSPVMLEARLILVIGQLSAAAKLFPNGRTVNVPLTSTKRVGEIEKLSPSRITLLLEAKTFVPAFLPMTVLAPNPKPI